MTSGPNENYGFATTSSGERQTYPELQDAIRDFLNKVDPNTGYIE